MKITLPSSFGVYSNIKRQQKNYAPKKTANKNIPLSFEAIIYKKINPKYLSQKDELEKEIDKFSASGKNVKYLGEGVFSKAYSFDKMPNIVIKEAFDQNETFEQEQQNLEMIPDRIQNTQKFVARVYDDEEKKYYLLSTKVEGEAANFEKKPWTNSYLKNLFDTMFEMDKEGLYHGDLNNGNMKLDDGTVNFLDFQWASKVNKGEFFLENKESILPPFIINENSQMFEMAELPYYIKQMEKTDDAIMFLSNYLACKANYHKKRYDLIEQMSKQYDYTYESDTVNMAKSFEKAQAEIFERRPDFVLRTEAKKIRFLNSFREAYKSIDENVPNKNILIAGSAYLVTLSAIQDFRQEVARNKKIYEDELKEIKNKESGFFYSLFASKEKVDSNKNKKEKLQLYVDYLEGQEKYGDFWFEKLESWTKDAYAFPLRHTTGRINYWESLYSFNNPNVNLNDFGRISNILLKFGGYYITQYSRNFSVDSEKNTQEINEIDGMIKDLSQAISTGQSVYSTKSELDELKDIQERIQRKNHFDWNLDIINLALLGILRARQLSEYLTLILQIDKLEPEEQEYIKKAKVLAQGIQEKYESISNRIFQTVYDDIISSSPPSTTMCGYKGMENF